MLKKIKWIILIILSIGIILLTYAMTLLRYAETEVEALERYRLSLASLPEVEEVREVHRFNGLESYIVASIVLERGYDVYYFVFDDTVQHFFFASDLITEEEALQIAMSLIREAEMKRIILGILNEMPIFEVQMELEDEIHYIVINALTGSVVMNFQI